MNPVTSFLMLACLAAACAVGYWVNLYLGLVLLAVGLVIGSSLKMANVWQKFVILRLGKLQSVGGAGLFAIIPVIDSVIAVIDARIQTTACVVRRRYFEIHEGDSSLKNTYENEAQTSSPRRNVERGPYALEPNRSRSGSRSAAHSRRSPGLMQMKSTAAK